MTDEDRKRVEEIRAAREADTLIFWEDRVDDLLEIIDRMRTVTREDMERVAKAVSSAYRDCVFPGEFGVPAQVVMGYASADVARHIARAALHSMGFEVAE